MNFKKLNLNKNLSYYDENAESFYKRTINANLSQEYKKFGQYIKKGGHILDAGCGSGRDINHFLEQGYKVTAFDASEKMSLLAQKETGLDILTMTFQDGIL